MLTLERLTKAVREDAAIRRIRRLQPVGGSGDKVFPPTYPGEGRNAPPRHVFELRRFDGKDILCVLIDSVQSQANRLEEALKNLRMSTGLSFPVIAVDFKGTPVADLGQITSLDAPHRVFDAIIRDSQKGNVRFRDTEEGKRLVEAKAQNAAAVFELSPTALLFGAWNSTGQGGGLGAKFPRCLVSEIVGVGVATDAEGKASGQRTGSRVDPLGIRSGVKVYKDVDGDWTLDAPKKAEALKPSEINHSNIAPTVQQLGVSIEYALHTFVLSCAALRRLRFVDPNQVTAADGAAQTALAALGLAALVAQDRDGYALRSRCDLVAQEGQGATLEIVKSDGSREPADLSGDAAVALLKSAAGRAAELGVRWSAADLVLEPQPKLVELVRQSRELAMKGAADAEQAET